MEPWLYPPFAALFGLLIGSFLNVCALRWPQDRSIVSPPSSCPGCGKRIRWYHNVPVIGWAVLGGRCRDCREPISIQYPAVELATGLIWGGMILLHGPTVEGVRGALFLTILLGISVSDARFYIIPDQFSIGGAVLGLAFSFFTPALTWVQAGAGALTGFLLLWFVAWAGEKAFGKEAMGGGDIKMMAMIGAFLGIPGVLLTIFLGSLLGAVIFGPISMKTGKLVPFGIFLALGAAVSWFAGDALVSWYMAWAFGP